MDAEAAAWNLLKLVIVAAVAYLVVITFLPSSSNSTQYLNQCTPTLTYSCSGPSLTNGNLSVLIAQNSGIRWGQVNVFFVASGSVSPTSVPPLPCESGFAGLAPSSSVEIMLDSYSYNSTCFGFPTTPNQIVTGNLWAGYQTPSNNTEHIVEIGSITVTSR